MNNEESKDLKKCIEKIEERNLDEAKELLADLLSKNDHSAEIYNLIGVVNELLGNIEMAITHYRIASTVDPSYEKSNKNLERVISINYKRTEREILY